MEVAVPGWHDGGGATPGILHCALRASLRLFKIEIETWEHGGGAVKVIASIEEPAVSKQILAHLERRAAAAIPAFRPFARAPPPTALPGLREPG